MSKVGEQQNNIILTQLEEGIRTIKGDYFRIDPNKIGSTNISSIFEGVMTRSASHTPVAIKMHTFYSLEDNKIHDNVMTEGYKELQIHKLLKKNRHDNIIQYYGTYFSENYLVIVLELAECSLFDYVIKNETRFSHYIMAQQMAKALNFLHQNKVLHLDVKLSNFLIIGDRIVLTDFGKSLPFRNGYPSTNPRFLTHPENLPPEYQIDKYCTVNELFDVWGYGLVIASVFMETVFKFPTVRLCHMTYSNGIKHLLHFTTEQFKKDLIKNTLNFDPEKRLKFPQILEMF